MSSVIRIFLPQWQPLSKGGVLPFATSAFSDGCVDLLVLLLTTQDGANSGISGPVEGISPPVLRLAPDV
ncbi:hypothetical protein [Thermogemmatispora sp.]|uniref:hypothetical protein n=1 Tax=Thermogemmatispora sp. TaxID=1968838 RepID=UPI001D87F1B1|nr:hypothetical protein [Thermogemmatispora sp.]MBX5449517.1 hypothetical protein [Thermogemmatispora sp.]